MPITPTGPESKWLPRKTREGPYARPRGFDQFYAVTLGCRTGAGPAVAITYPSSTQKALASTPPIASLPIALPMPYPIGYSTMASNGTKRRQPRQVLAAMVRMPTTNIPASIASQAMLASPKYMGVPGVMKSPRWRASDRTKNAKPNIRRKPKARATVSEPSALSLIRPAMPQKPPMPQARLAMMPRVSPGLYGRKPLSIRTRVPTMKIVPNQREFMVYLLLSKDV